MPDDYTAVETLGEEFANALEDWANTVVDTTHELADMATEAGISLDFTEDFTRGFNRRMGAILASILDSALDEARANIALEG